MIFDAEYVTYYAGGARDTRAAAIGVTLFSKPAASCLLHATVFMRKVESPIESEKGELFDMIYYVVNTGRARCALHVERHYRPRDG